MNQPCLGGVVSGVPPESEESCYGKPKLQPIKGMVLSWAPIVWAYLLKTQLFNFLGNMGYMSVKD